MPTVMRTSEDVQSLFKQIVEGRGLNLEHTPAAVQLAVQALGEHGGVYNALLADLPASSRAWEWMECAFLAYADWCAKTIVVDSEEAPQPPAVPGA